METVNTLNFADSNVLAIDYNILSRTYKEVNFNGVSQNPTGMFHTDVIDNVMNICTKHNMNFEIKSMFAANNKQKNAEGVSISKQLEEQYGIRAVEAHVLRRVFTTIQINDLSDNETTTGIAIAYHQNGLQIGIGPYVRICSNQCILSYDRFLSTYGENRIKDNNKIFQIIDDWILNFSTQRQEDIAIINKMKSIETSYDDVMRLIGNMNAIRVARDSSNKLIRNSDYADIKYYPLNQGQISDFVESYLIKCLETNSTYMSLWDIYNIATNMYKPEGTDIPSIIPQNLEMSKLLLNMYN